MVVTASYALIRAACTRGARQDESPGLPRALALVGGGLAARRAADGVHADPGGVSTPRHGRRRGAQAQELPGARCRSTRSAPSPSPTGGGARAGAWANPDEGNAAVLFANYNERTFYAGTVTLLLAVAGLLCGGRLRRKAPVRAHRAARHRRGAACARAALARAPPAGPRTRGDPAPALRVRAGDPGARRLRPPGAARRGDPEASRDRDPARRAVGRRGRADLRRAGRRGRRRHAAALPRRDRDFRQRRARADGDRLVPAARRRHRAPRCCWRGGAPRWRTGLAIGLVALAVADVLPLRARLPADGARVEGDPAAHARHRPARAAPRRRALRRSRRHAPARLGAGVRAARRARLRPAAADRADARAVARDDAGAGRLEADDRHGAGAAPDRRAEPARGALGDRAAGHAGPGRERTRPARRPGRRGRGGDRERRRIAARARRAARRDRGGRRRRARGDRRRRARRAAHRRPGAPASRGTAPSPARAARSRSPPSATRASRSTRGSSGGGSSSSTTR